ncbi:MAG: class I SAM-dependent methyltransferase [Promethearchaeota archaeon]
MSCVFESNKAAERYDAARSLPEETLTLWMDKLRESVPTGSITSILDLGAGTGRFTACLRDTFGCPVVAVDPSEAMLRQGKRRQLHDIQCINTTAENMPLKDTSIDLIWMSQVFHHLKNRMIAIQEMQRVLRLGGHLAIRNATQESETGNQWSRFFPEASNVSIPREEIITVVCGCGFETIAVHSVPQVFAWSYTEYYEKIRQRGLSPLLVISDEAFANGMERLKQWITTHSPEQPVIEPLDLFVFKLRERR